MTIQKPKSELEAEVEIAFVKFAESKGCQALKLRIDGKNGWPDRTVITPQGVFFVEFKSAKGRLRPMQRFYKSLLESLGFVVLTPKLIGEAENFLKEFISGKKEKNRRQCWEKEALCQLRNADQ